MFFEVFYSAFTKLVSTLNFSWAVTLKIHWFIR